MRDFVHLHVHTQYSLLDGQASVPNLVDKAIRDGMKGIAVTDHGNMFAIKEFYNYVNKKNSVALAEIRKENKSLQLLQISAQSQDNTEKIKACRETIKKLTNGLFKPIIGCEMYVAPRGMGVKEGKQDQGGYHLIVLAKNQRGYHNLIKLVSHAWTQGYYMRPRTDRTELEKYHEGLIVCSACLGGEVPKLIVQDQLSRAQETVLWFKKIFGDDYYLELQRHKVTNPVIRANRDAYPLQVKVNKYLLEYATKYNIKVICTNDVHFVDEENAEAHDRLICLSTGKDLNDPTRMIYTKQEWMKTRAEMNELFDDIPQALTNTIEILDKVEFYSIDHDPIMPTFTIPEDFGTEEEYRKKYTEQDLFNEFTTDEHGNVIMSREEAKDRIIHMGGYDKLYRIKLEGDYLAKLAFDGAKKLYGDPLSEGIRNRLIYELHVMKTMGFPGYFLIVQDFINAARNELHVSVGPGRGSVAGSAVAYCLGITQIDPIKYDLLFERFLNPDRISLPDIDVDFDDDGRGEVLRWVTNKYGQEKVAHIITYSTMATKMAIKDVARVQKLPLSESDRLCKLIPNRIPDKNNPDEYLKMSLPNAIAYVPELQAAESSPDELMRDTIKYAKMLEGNVRGTGVHACGTIICRDDITDWVPVSTADDKETGEKMLVTQYEGSVIEDTGLIKMDFLGLTTLSIIKEALENIRLTKGEEVDIDHISLTDPATYKLYCDGRTVGTFQFESAGMQKYLRELQPSSFEDLIAMNALYRPGPMNYIPDFIERKQGRKPIEYDIPVMEKYLKETYGITVYQEQVMLLSRLLADFTGGQSDTLRKAMGKKQRDKLAKLKPKFIEGGKKNGHDPQILEKIWGDWEKFAKYAFNKSHATCYSWVAYQTAYLKANYPSEYMAAVMSRSLSSIADITKLMDECKTMGIQILGSDVNESNRNFTVNAQGNIRFGLGAIKGVGEAAVRSIVSERRQNGLYKDIFDFVRRVNLNACNKKSLECLVLAGALDGFKQLSREQYLAQNAKGESYLDLLIRYGNRCQMEKLSMANTLFGSDIMVPIETPKMPENVERWSELERLNKERELVGIYLSAHPLDRYAVVLDHICNTKIKDLEQQPALVGHDLILGGIVTGVRTGVSKNGNPFGVFKLEDYSGSAEIPLFGKDWVAYQGYVTQGAFLYIKAKYQPKQWKPDNMELKILNMELLSEVKDALVKKITVFIPLSMLSMELVEELDDWSRKCPGKTELCFRITDDEDKNQMSVNLVSRAIRLSISKEFMLFLTENKHLGYRIN